MRLFLYVVTLTTWVLPAMCLAQQTMGLYYNQPGSQDGYVLFSPIMSNNTYLIDKCGREVHQWNGSRKPGQSVYLLEDGTLLRPANANNSTFTGGGVGGVIERFDWSGGLLWTYAISDTAQCQHHDVCYLPNGNILAIVWEKKSVAEAIAMGRNPSSLGSSLWSEKIVELQPVGAGSATIVWEWHVWDHLSQDFSAAMPGFGVISDHPGLININYTGGAPGGVDWLHINSIDYNPALDQVMLSNHNFSEIWILDHSTTTAEATGHTGGMSGKGGDLLYRWGNPATYDRGTATDRKLYGQHNAQWIKGGLPDSGKIIVFNNGQGRPGGNYSSIDILQPPVGGLGDYSISSGAAFLPLVAEWSYQADTTSNFYAANISGTQRLANGNTLVCSGPSGTFFEIDAVKKMVWKYINPVNNAGPMTQGNPATQNMVFRCTLYDESYPGFAGHALVPGSRIEINPLVDMCNTGLSGNFNESTPQLHIVNPFSDDIILTSVRDMNNVSISLTGMTGNTLIKWENQSLPGNKQVVFSIPVQLPFGLYVLSIADGSRVVHYKIIRQ